MGCMGDREKGPKDETQRWDFITLSDFRCTSAWTYVAYVWLWLMALVGIAVYVVDTFTAVQLLAYNNWSSQVKPALAFEYSKWIFAGCILLSWVLCFYEWFRALRVIKRGGVAESFLDPLAVTLQSIRPQGFKRFLVFSALTKSKKGADYVALFVYFSFKTAIRVILAEGPRQGINAMTLWAVLQSDIAVKAASDHSSFEQFFLNIGALAEEQPLQATIYFAMLFTLVIWAFSALSLIISVMLYLGFLWHYIPSSDGRLSVYCRRKVDRRLAKVVEHKVKAAIEEEDRQAKKAEWKAELKRQKTGEMPLPAHMKIVRKPTLPELGKTPEMNNDEKFPLARQDTTSSTNTLPLYTRDPIQRQPTLPKLNEHRPGAPTRSDTQASAWSTAPSYSSHAPLVANAGYPGESDLPPLPPIGHDPQDTFGPQQGFAPAFNPSFNPGPPRMQTPMSNSNQSFATDSSGYRGAPAPAPRFPPPVRSNTGFQTFDPEPPRSAYPPPMRSATADGYRPPPPPKAQDNAFSTHPSFSRPNPGPMRKPVQMNPYTPAPQQNQQPPAPAYEMTNQPSHTLPPPPPHNAGGGYVAFNPNAMPIVQDGPRRNITVSNGAPSATGNHFGNVQPARSATAPIPEDVRRDNFLLQAPPPLSRGTESVRVSEILNAYGADGGSGRSSPWPPQQHPTPPPPSQDGRHYG